ncbi:MAG: type II secretion system F family protein, partial [Anaerovorax sp.]
TGVAGDLEGGMPFSEALEKTGAFPVYMVKMAQVGYETGTLDQVMGALSTYYDKEHQLAKSIKSALTYPLVMVFILLVVFFVLLTKVMPIFEGIYEQVGLQLSHVAKSAIGIGGVISGVLLVILVMVGLVALSLGILAKKGKRVQWFENLIQAVKERSKLAAAISKRRFTFVMALSIKSGLATDKGLELALDLVNEKKVKAMIKRCRTNFDQGMDFYDAMKDAALFGAMDLQMLKVGSAAGRLDVTMEKLSIRFEQQVDDSIDHMISRFEPTVVAVLAVIVGMILLSVMMPLVGIMSSIG